MVIKRTLLTRLSIDVFVDIVVFVIVIVIVVFAILFIGRLLLASTTTAEVLMGIRWVTEATTVEVEC